MPIALAALLDTRARRRFANEVAMHVGAGVWGVTESVSRWQSSTPSPQYERR